MKLEFIEVSGFRGFRDPLRIDLGTGFTVVSGRNGVGKSTLCDAVEFALTGSINKYRVTKTAMENMDDYLWWRGEPRPDDRHVRVGFRTQDGGCFTVTRTPDECDPSVKDIEEVLCSDGRPVDALQQLCKTSIIRDELIASLSVDLTETERFEFVRSALGAAEGVGLSSRAKAIIDRLKANQERHEQTYEATRSQLTEFISQLSTMQHEATRSTNIDIARRSVISALEDPPSDTLALLEAGRAEVVARRSRVSQMEEALRKGKELEEERQALGSDSIVTEKVEAEQALLAAAAAKADAERVIAEATEFLAQQEEADAVATSLSLLIEHGERLGLHEAHCPLCAAERTQPEFDGGLRSARERIQSLFATITAARQALADAQKVAKDPVNEHATAMNALDAIRTRERRLQIAEEEFEALLTRTGLHARFAANPGHIEAEISKERDDLIDFERALMTLETSQIISRAVELEERVNMLRKEVDGRAQIVERSQRALALARTMDRAVKRVNAEIIEERLAKISPILKELYTRLRPHVDWRTIDYNIRGDVRRFLSLRVGNGLNPQFVLSSGQRRAVGLAFLLSVYLARAWSPWRTLILDDPVQHIDDFRTLQFVEILSALRLDGRQILCTVEDEALADLVCRRLRNTGDDTGQRYDIDINPNGVPEIIDGTEFPPPGSNVFRQASSIHLAG